MGNQSSAIVHHLTSFIIRFTSYHYDMRPDERRVSHYRMMQAAKDRPLAKRPIMSRFVERKQVKFSVRIAVPYRPHGEL